MADSYAQLAQSRRSNSGVSERLPLHGQNSLHLHGSDLEEKVLSLAKLLRSTQHCQDDLAADQRSEMQQIMQRLSQLEEAVKRQSGSNNIISAPGAYNIKALAERLALVEQRLAEGLMENHSVHSHNAQVGYWDDNVRCRSSLGRCDLSLYCTTLIV